MNVLMSVDFSAVTTAMIEAVPDLVRAPAGDHLHIFLMHVAEPDPEFVGWEAGPEVVRDQMAAEFHREKKDLEDFAEKMRSAMDAQITPLLVQGPTVQTVCDEATKLDAELIVVGSHGHGATYDLFVGSISSGIIKKSNVPVLVVPAPDRPAA